MGLAITEACDWHFARTSRDWLAGTVELAL